MTATEQKKGLTLGISPSFILFTLKTMKKLTKHVLFILMFDTCLFLMKKQILCV